MLNKDWQLLVIVVVERKNRQLWNGLKKSLRLWLEINDKGVSRALGSLQTGNTTKQYTECSEEQRKAKSSSSKQYTLEKNQSYILSLWPGLRWKSSTWMVARLLDVRWSGYMNTLSLVLLG